MRARIDTGIESPDALIDAAYSDLFFAAHERQFRLEGGESETRDELRNIGRYYLILRRTEDSREMRRELRKQYVQLAKQTDIFLQILRNAAHDDIAFGLYMTALRLGEPFPATKFAGLSAHAQTQSGEPYFRELIRLLELLEKSAFEQADNFRERPGPKINLGLEFLVRRVADLFTTTLNRPFSIDHHKPVAASKAFDFVSALIAPLDDVSDTEITTAIRAKQNWRRKIKAKAEQQNMLKAGSQKIEK